MKQVEFGSPEGPDHHECTSTRVGDWLIFRCPLCPDYERLLNWRTGASHARNVRPDLRHSGRYVPIEDRVTSRYVH
jgi:hypothetical protein